MDNLTCAQAAIAGAFLQAIYPDFAAPILVLVVVVAVAADGGTEKL